MSTKHTTILDIHLALGQPARWEVKAVDPNRDFPEGYYVIKLLADVGMAPLTVFAEPAQARALLGELLTTLTSVGPGLLAELTGSPLADEADKLDPEAKANHYPTLSVEHYREVMDHALDEVTLGGAAMGPFSEPHSGGIYVLPPYGEDIIDDVLVYCTPGWERCQGIAFAVVRDGENVRDEHVPVRWTGVPVADALLWGATVKRWMTQYCKGKGGAQ